MVYAMYFLLLPPPHMKNNDIHLPNQNKLVLLFKEWGDLNDIQKVVLNGNFWAVDSGIQNEIRSIL